MAVTTQNSTEYGVGVVNKTRKLLLNEMGGTVKSAFFTCTQDGAGDATSSVALFKLPPGRVRVLMSQSRAYVNWTTASATLDLGWDAYVDLAGDAVAANPDGLIDGLSVDTVGFQTLEGAIAANLLTGGTYVFESTGGVVIRATSQDTAIVDLDDLVGYVLYVVES